MLGVTGLIGSTVFSRLFELNDSCVWGTARSSHSLELISSELQKNMLKVDFFNERSLSRLIKNLGINVIINCVGITKHNPTINDKAQVLELNSVLPHRLGALCNSLGVKFIHISTDCVFSGSKGGYRETDSPDAVDFYGRSKALAEDFFTSALVLRTSTIGHELRSQFGLLEWFLSQNISCKGYKNAHFSGLTTVELANVIFRLIYEFENISGLINVGSQKISKFDLLCLISEVYAHKIDIHPCDKVVVDRSLDCSLLVHSTGYVAPSWRQQIENMYEVHRFNRS